MPGRADHQDVVAAGRGDQEGALGVVLPLDVDEVVLVVRELAEDLVEIDGLRARCRPGRRGSRPPRPGCRSDRRRAPRRRRPRRRWPRGRAGRSRFSAAACKAIASTPLIGRVSPVRASSPTTANVPGRSKATWPLPSSSPSAIGRSKPPASFLRSAGARLITTRSIGRRYPELTIARSTRCVLSRTAASARPDQHRLGIGREGDVDLDFHRRGVDADERIRRELREHGSSVSAGSEIDQESAAPSQRLHKQRKVDMSLPCPGSFNPTSFPKESTDAAVRWVLDRSITSFERIVREGQVEQDEPEFGTVAEREHLSEL